MFRRVNAALQNAVHIKANIKQFCEDIFVLDERKASFDSEVYYGFIQFVSCLYVLPVLPGCLEDAGYDTENAIVAISFTCCLGCSVGGFLTNLPFVIAPPAAVSIFLGVTMQQKGLRVSDANISVLISGTLLLLAGVFPPLLILLAKLIPDCILAATAVGIGLLTALAGAIHISLIVSDSDSLLAMGDVTPEVMVAFSCIVIVSVALYYRVRGAFCIGLGFGTVVWWLYVKEELTTVVSAPILCFGGLSSVMTTDRWTPIVYLSVELFFLYVLTLNGLMRSLSDMGHLTKPDGAVPGGRWLYIICGASTVISGLIGAFPVLISPESAAGIKAGARTGLSTCVCGLLFGVSAFLGPLFAAVPHAGTAPLLILIGVLLFQNTQRIDWADSRFAVPAFCCLFFIPFTYSLSRGVYLAFLLYITIGVFTDAFWADVRNFLSDYDLPLDKIVRYLPLMCAPHSKVVVMHSVEGDPNEVSVLNSNSPGGCLEGIPSALDLPPVAEGKSQDRQRACFDPAVDQVINLDHVYYNGNRLSRSGTICSTVADFGDDVNSPLTALSPRYRARSATAVLRGGDRFDINIPGQNPESSSLLFLERVTSRDTLGDGREPPSRGHRRRHSSPPPRTPPRLMAVSPEVCDPRSAPPQDYLTDASRRDYSSTEDPETAVVISPLQEAQRVSCVGESMRLASRGMGPKNDGREYKILRSASRGDDKVAE